MKLITFCDFVTVKDGWYWVKRYAGDAPRPIWVSWGEHRQYGRRLRFDFGDRAEADYFPGKPDISDGVESVVLFGPIEVPPEIA